MEPTLAPPGWYPGVVPGQIRYWDGARWTGELATAAKPSQQSAFPPAGKVAIVAGIVALIGSFLPWVSVLTGFGTIEVSGFDAGDGKLTAAAAVAAILLGYLGLAHGAKAVVVLGVLAAGGGLAVSIYDWNNLNNAVSDVDAEFARASVGNGLYACAAGFVVCIVSLLAALPDRTGQTALLR